MHVKGSTWLILVGLLLAVIGATRTAPILVQAMSSTGVDPVEAALAEGVTIDQTAQPAAFTGASSQTQPGGAGTTIKESYGLLPTTVHKEGSSQAQQPDVGAAATSAGNSAQVRLQEDDDTTPAVPQGEAPLRLVIPSIELDAPVVVSEAITITVAGKEYRQWMVPGDSNVGWHIDSALVGLPGNTVINGHHNVEGMVFANLEHTQVGDVIVVFTQNHRYEYQISNKMILPEKYEQLDVRMENARWILPSKDERLTLITCWPFTSNTHRLIIVARRINTVEEESSFWEENFNHNR